KTRTHALWALLGAGTVIPEFLLRLLNRDDPLFVSWGVRAAGDLGSSNERLVETMTEMAGDSRLVAADVLLQLAIAVPKITPAETRTGLLLSILARSKNDPLIPRVVWQNLHPLIESNPSFVKELGEWWPVAGSQLQPLLPRISERLIGSKILTPPALT